MRDFHMTYPNAIRFPRIQAHVLLAFHAETHPMCPAERDSDGYIAQEIERLKQRK